MTEVLRMVAHAGGVNIVIPPGLDGGVTIRGRAMPWAAALQSVLASRGLWYRYRPSGELLRIAPRRQLDDEARDDRARQRDDGPAPGTPAPAPPAP